VALPVWLNNLIAYSLQIAVLAGSGTLLAYLFRVRAPRIMHGYWQLLLLVCLLLPCLQTWQHPIVSRSVRVTETVAAQSVAVQTSVATMIPGPAKPVLWKYLPHVLFGGILLRLLWLGIGFLRLKLLKKKSHLFSEERTIVQDMQWRTGVRVTVLLSSAVHSPVTFGFRSPTVLLPLSFQELSEPCKQAVICHELMHVRRYDWVTILAEEFIRSVFWFHPAVWWLLNRIQLSREQAVDQEVVRLMGTKQHYLDSLLEFARTHQRLRTVPAPLFLREHHLVERVALLLKEVSMSRTRLIFSMTGIMTLLIATLFLSIGWFPLTGEPVYAQEQTKAFETKRPAPQIVVPERPQIPQIAAVLPPVALAAAPVAVPQQEAQTEMTQPKRSPIRVGGNAAEARLIYKVTPVYPVIAVRTRVSGDVVLMVTIDEQGLVSDVQVISGHTMLVDAAVTAVKQWRYSPTLLNGEAVPVLATVTIKFELMDPNDLQVMMDSSGNLNADINQMLQTKGTVRLRIMQETPYGAANSAVQNLLQQGLQRMDVVGSTYVLYQGRLYYTGSATPINYADDGIMQAFAAVMTANQGMPMQFNYRIFISETGEVVGLQRLMGGAEYPDFETAVLHTRIGPVLLNGEPVPYAKTVSLFR
jgi:TonB family protein